VEGGWGGGDEEAGVTLVLYLNLNWSVLNSLSDIYIYMILMGLLFGLMEASESGRRDAHTEAPSRLILFASAPWHRLVPSL
jgi:hypothetical protein